MAQDARPPEGRGAEGAYRLSHVGRGGREHQGERTQLCARRSWEPRASGGRDAAKVCIAAGRNISRYFCSVAVSFGAHSPSERPSVFRRLRRGRCHLRARIEPFQSVTAPISILSPRAGDSPSGTTRVFRPYCDGLLPSCSISRFFPPRVLVPRRRQSFDYQKLYSCFSE